MAGAVLYLLIPVLNPYSLEYLEWLLFLLTNLHWYIGRLYFRYGGKRFGDIGDLRGEWCCCCHSTCILSLLLLLGQKKKKNQEIHNWALSCWSSLTSTDLTFIISCSYVLAKIPVTDILNFCHLQESSATAFHGWWLTLSGFIPEKRTVWIFCWQRVLLWLQGLLCCTSVGGSGWELNIRSLPLRL